MAFHSDCTLFMGLICIVVMVSNLRIVIILSIANILLSYALPYSDSAPQQFGLIYDEKTKCARQRYRLKHSEGNTSSSVYTYDYHDKIDGIHVVISISKKNLEFVDDYNIKPVLCLVNYSSNVPLALSYDLDFTLSAELINKSWYWLPPSSEASTIISVHILPKLLGLDYLVFWIRKAKRNPQYNSPTQWFHNDSDSLKKQYFSSLVTEQPKVTLFGDPNANDDNENNTLGFPVIVIADKGIGHLAFRILVIIMVTTFTFTMGCELDISLMVHHFKKPIPVSIGFFCQFFFMPLIALSIGKVIPIRPEFGFGLLTIGCSPGGGVSNAWSLLLGGDINLSILMTFISSFSALFHGRQSISDGDWYLT
ncbi:Sodium/bile acid cotransporter [Schistosoma japonicum]|nr:Sodium/bile acid cotransporter [Schistosoma japonicum]